MIDGLTTTTSQNGGIYVKSGDDVKKAVSFYISTRNGAIENFNLSIEDQSLYALNAVAISQDIASISETVAKGELVQETATVAVDTTSEGSAGESSTSEVAE